MGKDLYHEKQEWELCLMHSLNALFQEKKFTTSSMNHICNQLAPDKLINPHKSIFRTGNYDANVMISALHRENIDVQWFDSRKADSELSLDDAFLCPEDAFSEFMGFIVNNPQKKLIVFNRRHWLTIKRINGVWFNLDSKKAAPQRYDDEEKLLKWMVTACKNGAELMICRRKRNEDYLEKDCQRLSAKFNGKRRTSSKRRYSHRTIASVPVIPLPTPSAVDHEDSSEQSTEITSYLPNANSNGNHGQTPFVDASDGYKAEPPNFKKPALSIHLSYQM